VGNENGDVERENCKQQNESKMEKSLKLR